MVSRQRAALRTSRWSQKMTDESGALDPNRAGRDLPPARHRVLNDAKDEPRRSFADRCGTKRKTSRKRNARKSR
jgi:hypothetical protein